MSEAKIPFHNKFGLMGGNIYECIREGTFSRDEVCPFSLMSRTKPDNRTHDEFGMGLEEEDLNWYQHGVYDTLDAVMEALEGKKGNEETEYDWCDTNKLLDAVALDDDAPFLDLATLK